MDVFPTNTCCQNSTTAITAGCGVTWGMVEAIVSVHKLYCALLGFTAKLLVGRRPKTFISLRTNFRMLMKTVNTMKFFKISESVK
jgi:hypothetical protein